MLRVASLLKHPKAALPTPPVKYRWSYYFVAEHLLQGRPLRCFVLSILRRPNCLTKFFETAVRTDQPFALLRQGFDRLKASSHYLNNRNFCTFKGICAWRNNEGCGKRSVVVLGVKLTANLVRAISTCHTGG